MDIGLQVQAVDIRISTGFRRNGRTPGSTLLTDKLLRGTSFVRGACSGVAPRTKAKPLKNSRNLLQNFSISTPPGYSPGSHQSQPCLPEAVEDRREHRRGASGRAASWFPCNDPVRRAPSRPCAHLPVSAWPPPRMRSELHPTTSAAKEPQQRLQSGCGDALFRLTCRHVQTRRRPTACPAWRREDAPLAPKSAGRLR
jgi:hypothetical protein